MGKHVALPWGFSEGDSGSPEYAPEQPNIGSESSSDVVCWLETDCYRTETWMANAALIVKAVNHHQNLVHMVAQFVALKKAGMIGGEGGVIDKTVDIAEALLEKVATS